MRGLMKSEPKPAAPGPGAPGGRQPNAAPDEQAQYDQLVKNGMRLIYDQAAVPQIVQSLEGAGDPVAGLVNTLVLVMTRLVGSAQQKGASIAPDVMLHGAGELLGQLADFSAETGGHKYTDDELRTVATMMVKGPPQQGEGAEAPAPGPEMAEAGAPMRRGLGG